MALDYPEEHRREALGITAAVVILLALVCFFLKFNGPNPPLTALGGDGVELNYGLDEAGSGDIQTTAIANASLNREDSRPPAATQPQPTPAQPRAEPTPAPTPQAQEKVITSDAEEAGATAPPADKPTPKAVEPMRETPTPPKPREQPRTLYTPKGSASGVAGGNGTNGTSSAPTGNSNGDRPGTVGDQGDPRGSLNAKALYGEPGSGGSGARPGSGGGGGLEMSGWAIDNVPDIPKIDDNPGVARFKIVINNDGDVISVTRVSGSVSPEQAQAVRNALQKATFRNLNGQDGGAIGYYNFRYLVK